MLVLWSTRPTAAKALSSDASPAASLSGLKSRDAACVPIGDLRDYGLSNNTRPHCEMAVPTTASSEVFTSPHLRSQRATALTSITVIPLSPRKNLQLSVRELLLVSLPVLGCCGLPKLLLVEAGAFC